MLGDASAGKIMKQTYLVKPSQLIKFLATASVTSSADSSDSELSTDYSSSFNDVQPAPARTKYTIKETYFSSSEDDIPCFTKKQIQPLSSPSPLSSCTSPAGPENSPRSPTFPPSSSGRIDASPAVSDQVLSDVSEISLNFGFLALSPENHSNAVQPVLSDTHSIEAPDYEWDPYASSPTFSNPSKSVSFNDPSNKSPPEEKTSPFQRWTSSRRPIKKNWGCKSCPNSGREPNQDSEEENV